MGHKASPPVTRREALCRIGSGFGMMAFASLVSRTALAANLAQTSKAAALSGGLHHPAKAKAVIFLFMNGGLSQVDSFNPKPMLDKFHGQPLPGGTVATERKTGALMKSPFTFQRHGKSGLEVSELFPHVGACADDICVIRSMHTDIPNHEPSMLMMNTGHIQVGRPSIGSWLTYGLGSDNKNLPGYVVLCPDIPTTVGPPLWNSAFLPAMHQGTYIPSKVERPDQIVGKDFDPKKLVSFIHNQSFTLPEQRRELDLIETLDKLQRGAAPPDPNLEAAIGSMEVPDADRGARRLRHPQGDEGDAGAVRPGSTARGCLMAVRLVERGVRMVQIYYAKGNPWDAHADIQQHRKNAKDSDQPFAAVVKDLKSRGLFDSTLVVCGSEFGRTPVVEVGGGAGGVASGRDHNPFGFSVWLAGGGVKGGITYGATDDFGFKAVEKPVHVHDLHATILHLLGIDHTKLTYQYSGRDFRLTDVSGTVLHDILA